MTNNFYKTFWQNILLLILQTADTFYRVGVRLLYHSKVVGVFLVFVVIVFIASSSFYLSVSHDSSKDLHDRDNRAGQNFQGFYVIDVGQGDALLYITNNNQTLLIDTGKPGNGIVGKLEKILGKYRKKIDVIVLTHPDSDHVGELDKILATYNVGLILYSPIYDARPDSKNNANGSKALTLPVFAGENLSFSESEKVYFLSPSVSGMTTFINKKEIAEDNYFSVVSMIKNEDAIFAMADAPQKIEKVLVFDNLYKITGEELYRNDFKRVILKVGHHGSKTSSAPEFIQALSPTDAVLSFGKNNRYGHPHKEVLDMFLNGTSSQVTLSSTSISMPYPVIKIHRTISGTVYFEE